MSPKIPLPRRFAPLLLLSILACGPSGEPARGHLELVGGGDGERPNFHDLGTLAYGELAEHTFSLRNSGTDAVRILNVRAACACSTPRLGYRDEDGIWVAGNARNRDGPALVLPAGRTAELTLRVDTVHVQTLNVDKLVLVRLQSDAPTTPFLTFELHLIVERLFQATPDPLDLGAVPTGGGGSARTELARATRVGAATILRVISATPPFETTLESWDSFGRPIWGLTAALPADLALGPVFGEITLATTDKNGAGEDHRFTLSVRAQVVTDWLARPAQLILRPASGARPGASPEAATLEATTTVEFLLPGTRQTAPRWTLEGAPDGAITVDLEPADPAAASETGASASWRLRLRAAAGALPRHATGTIRLRAQTEALPELSIPWRAP
jgi:hypothetical protein